MDNADGVCGGWRPRDPESPKGDDDGPTELDKDDGA